jgi:hypothetical protein
MIELYCNKIVIFLNDFIYLVIYFGNHYEIRNPRCKFANVTGRFSD